MAIRFHPERAIYDSKTDTVRVPALDGNRLVICAIAHDAIRKALRDEDGPVTYLLDAYRRFRLSFHIIANYKYRAHRVEPDGTVLVAASDFPGLEPFWDESDTLN